MFLSFFDDVLINQKIPIYRTGPQLFLMSCWLTQRQNHFWVPQLSLDPRKWGDLISSRESPNCPIFFLSPTFLHKLFLLLSMSLAKLDFITALAFLCSLAAWQFLYILPKVPVSAPTLCRLSFWVHPGAPCSSMHMSWHFWLTSSLLRCITPELSLKRPKSGVQGSELVVSSPPAPRISNSTISWSLQSRLTLGFTFPISPSLLVITGPTQSSSILAPLSLEKEVVITRKSWTSYSGSKGGLRTGTPLLWNKPDDVYMHSGIMTNWGNFQCT